MAGRTIFTDLEPPTLLRLRADIDAELLRLATTVADRFTADAAGLGSNDDQEGNALVPLDTSPAAAALPPADEEPAFEAHVAELVAQIIPESPRATDVLTVADLAPEEGSAASPQDPAEARPRKAPLSEEEKRERQRRYNRAYVERMKAALGPVPPRPGTWTAEEDADLVRLAHDLLPSQEIAAKLGRTYDAVRNRIKDLRAQGVQIPNRKKGGKRVTSEEKKARKAERNKARPSRAGAKAPALVDVTAAPKPRALSVVEAAIREVPAATPVARTAQPSILSDREPQGDMRRAVLRRLDHAAQDPAWSPPRDLALVEAVIGGARFDGAAERLGIAPEVAEARWRLLVAPIQIDGFRLVGPKGSLRRVPQKVNHTEGQDFLVAELRRRAAQTSVAAE